MYRYVTEMKGPVEFVRPSGRRWGMILLQAVAACLGLAVVGGTVALVWLFLNAKPIPTAQVGDCMVAGAGDRFEIVDCADQSAAFTVVGRLEGRAQPEAAEACKALKEEAPERAYWEGQSGGSGVVLCLKSRAKPSPA